jgi:hypothetical protein
MGYILVCIIVVCTALAINGFAQRQRHPRLPKRFVSQVCTKHVILKSWLPGGPDRFVPRYGRHRTPGSQCDGGKHERKSPWW